MWESEYIDSCNVSLANPEPDNDPDDFEHKFENTTILLANTGETYVIGAYHTLLQGTLIIFYKHRSISTDTAL